MPLPVVPCSDYYSDLGFGEYGESFDFAHNPAAGYLEIKMTPDTRNETLRDLCGRPQIPARAFGLSIRQRESRQWRRQPTPGSESRLWMTECVCLPWCEAPVSSLIQRSAATAGRLAFRICGPLGICGLLYL